MIKKLTLLIVVVLFLSVQQGISQEWLVPADKQNIENPSDYNLENVKKGKDLYMTNCKSCHGDAGKNNSLALVPLPPDIASETMHKNSEGSMFYKMSTGKGLMPAFESTLSETDRWLLVNYIMNYSPDNTPVWVDLPPVKANLSAKIDADKRLVTVFAEFKNKDGKQEKLTETPINICVERAFGNLPIGQVLTNKNGAANFTIPEDIIGDEEGFVVVVVSLGENYEAKKVILEKAKIGIIKETPKLIKPGVIWSTNPNIPMWMLLSYLGAVGGAWLAIFYVIFQIIKIRKLSKE
jgi:mono/diheme cytochrome c family protein